MKKFLSMLVSIAMVLTMLVMPMYAADASISNVSINANSTGSNVTVNGYISSGNGQYVTIKVLDPNGDLDYVSQTTSSDSGKFNFLFSLKQVAQGNYSIKIGGEGVTTLYTGSFQLSTSTDTKPFVIITNGALERSNGIVATVDVGLNSAVETHSGKEVVVFELMKGTTPVSIVALTKDITAQEQFTAYFNVDPNDNSYTVRAYVLDSFNSDSTAPISLAQQALLK